MIELGDVDRRHWHRPIGELFFNHTLLMLMLMLIMIMIMIMIVLVIIVIIMVMIKLGADDRRHRRWPM